MIPPVRLQARVGALASAVTRQQGLGDADVRAERQAYRDRNADILAEAARRQRHRRHMDFGESSRDRAERLHQPVEAGSLRVLDEPVDGLIGALPRYTL